MFIRVPAQLLFDPGRAELHSDATVTLRQIAAALKEIPGRDFLVAGYTDAQLAKTATFKSNWDLSTARAVAVTRVLQQEGVDPRHLAAAGYSEFVPLVDAPSTPAEHALNDRLEVTVMPTADELPGAEPPATTTSSTTSPSTTTTAPTSAAPAPAPSSPAAAPLPPPGSPPR
jgi:chemotaxis protein MotB